MKIKNVLIRDMDLDLDINFYHFLKQVSIDRNLTISDEFLKKMSKRRSVSNYMDDSDSGNIRPSVFWTKDSIEQILNKEELALVIGHSSRAPVVKKEITDLSLLAILKKHFSARPKQLALDLIVYDITSLKKNWDVLVTQFAKNPNTSTLGQLLHSTTDYTAMAKINQFKKQFPDISINNFLSSILNFRKDFFKKYPNFSVLFTHKDIDPHLMNQFINQASPHHLSWLVDTSLYDSGILDYPQNTIDKLIVKLPNKEYELFLQKIKMRKESPANIFYSLNPNKVKKIQIAAQKRERISAKMNKCISIKIIELLF